MNYIRNIRTSKNYRRNPGIKSTIVTRSPGTRRRLGNNSLRIWEKGIEKNSISTVYSKYNYPCAIGYNPYIRRRFPNKHTIQVGKIR
jgi:hypothetical protein